MPAAHCRIFLLQAATTLHGIQHLTNRHQVSVRSQQMYVWSSCIIIMCMCMCMCGIAAALFAGICGRLAGKDRDGDRDKDGQGRLTLPLSSFPHAALLITSIMSLLPAHVCFCLPLSSPVCFRKQAQVLRLNHPGFPLC